MKSISRHLRATDIAAQLRMERQRNRGAFILLEGAHDIKRFGKFFDLNICSIINCYGKDNVIGAIEIEQNSIRSDTIGFVDADFDRITNNHSDNDDIIHSFCHDFDLDVCRSDAISRYLDEMGDTVKIDGLGGIQFCIESLLLALKPLSALRYANIRHKLRYSLKNLSHEEFFDGTAVDVDAMIEHVSHVQFASPAQKSMLKQYIERYYTADFDLWQFTNGHDFFVGLGIALRDRLGSRKVPQTWGSEVERHMRLAFDTEDFRQTGNLARISEWQQRSGHHILKAGL